MLSTVAVLVKTLLLGVGVTAAATETASTRLADAATTLLMVVMAGVGFLIIKILQQKRIALNKAIL